MLLTHQRRKPRFIFRNCFVGFAASIAALVLSSSETRADFWGWLSDLVIDDGSAELEEAALSEMALPPDAIVTGPAQARLITLGRDILELYPSTAITIDVHGKKTTVNLLAGTVRAKVAKRKQTGLFEVRTLWLVGTVKGTVFEVSTTGTASAVSVYEGRVAVKSRRSVGGVDVTPGKTATVSGNDRDPALSKTPSGGAATAAEVKSRSAASDSAENSGDEPTDNKGNDRSRDVNTSGRASSGGNSGPGNGSGGGVGGGTASQGGNDSDGEGGEGGEGEGGDGEGGEGGDDD